jgi:hypothetical protein
MDDHDRERDLSRLVFKTNGLSPQPHRPRKAWAVIISLVLLQPTGCASTPEQVRAQPSATGSFIIPQPLSVVVLNFVNTANAHTGDASVGVAKFVPGVSASVVDSAVSGLIYQVFYTVDFQAKGNATLVTYYIAGGIQGALGGDYRAEMIDFANGRQPPPPL